MHYFILSLLILLGAFLRLTNLSPLKIYPDSYQILMVAENITNFNGVLGTLGENGYLYPQFFGWTRPGMPIFIDLVNVFVKNLTLSARIVGLVSSVLIIPASYYLLTKLFASKKIGLISALLAAISYNLVVWSGFIYTESLGVFLLLTFLISFFNSTAKKPQLGDWVDIRTGLLFGTAVLTRYEYVIILFPLFLYLLFFSAKPLTRLVTIAVSLSIVISICFALLFPIQETLQVIMIQNVTHGLLTLFALGVCISIYFLKGFLNRILAKLSNQLPKILIIVTWGFFLYLLFQLLLPQSPFSNELRAIRETVFRDFLLSILTFIGFTISLLKKRHLGLTHFCFFSILLLDYSYFKTNPGMQRYTTHLFPFMLIFAGMAVDVIWSHKFPRMTKIGIFIFILLLILQSIISFLGIRQFGNSPWFKPGYDELSALKLRKLIPESDVLLITSLPESYYYATRIPTQSIADTHPFVFLDDSLNSKTIYIVQDMGMRDLFPTFSALLDSRFQSYKISSYWVGRDYHWATRSLPEYHPVSVYKSTLGELKESLRI